MRPVISYRSDVSSECIRSTVVFGSHRFYFLEPPWLNNFPDLSCIPAGEYECQYIDRSASGRYHGVYWIKEVPDRIGILIHNGVTVLHTLGCNLIGKRKGVYNGMKAVFNSRSALAEFVDIMDRKSFTLRIIGDQHVS